MTDLREMYALLMGKASAGFRIASGQTLTPLPFVSAVIDCLAADLGRHSARPGLRNGISARRGPRVHGAGSDAPGIRRA